MSDTNDPAAPLTILPDIAATATLLCQNVDVDPQPYNVPMVGHLAATVDHWKVRREIVEACVASPPMDADTIQNKVQFHISTNPGFDPPLTKSMLYALFAYGQLREGHEAIPPDGLPDPDAFWRPRAERQIRLLKALETIPADELALLTAETIDLFSHRLDAWITSLATRRLRELRAVRPGGCHIGGFGWIESLKPAAPAPVLEPPPPGFADVQVREEDTYVLAPSLHHATSAAVLRAGFESHTDEQAFGVNLVSGRSRRARWIVDGVRNGQPLGALLGYWIERELHEARKDEVIDDVRAAFPAPIVPDPDNPESAAAALEAIAPRNVVDGLAMYKAIAGTSEVPATPAQAAALAALTAAAPQIVKDLADLVDAVGDLVLAESVHQLVGGSPMRAGLAADTLGRGESLPSRFDVITSPRSGVGLTCSVAVMLPMAGDSVDRGWSGDRPRARLAPQAEAWVASLLGPRSSWKIACSVAGRSPGLRPRGDRSLRARRRLRAGHPRCGRSGSARAPHPGARARTRRRRRRCLRRARGGPTRHNVGAALEPREANHGSACRRAAAPGSASRSAEPVSRSRSWRRRVRGPRRCRIRIRDRGDGRAGGRLRCARRCVAGGSARADGRRCRRGRGGARRPRRKISRRPRRRDEGSSHGARGAGRGIVARGPPRGGAQGEPSARQRSRPWNRQQLSAGAARVGGGRRVGGGAGEARAGEADAIRSASAPRDARRHERARVDRAGVADPLEHRWRAIPDHVGLRGGSRGGARHEPCASGESRRRRPARHDDMAPSSCTRPPACERLPRPRTGAGASRRRGSAVVEGHPGAVGGSRRSVGGERASRGGAAHGAPAGAGGSRSATPPSAAG